MTWRKQNEYDKNSEIKQKVAKKYISATFLIQRFKVLLSKCGRSLHLHLLIIIVEKLNSDIFTNKQTLPFFPKKTTFPNRKSLVFSERLLYRSLDRNVTSSDIRATSSNLRFTSSNSRVTSSNPRVTSSNPRVMNSDLRVTSLNLQVSNSNPRVRRLKARVEAIKPRVK